MGVHSILTDEMAEYIFDQIATTDRSLRQICRDDNVARYSTVMRWIKENESFRDNYTRAKQQQAETLFDQIIEIADDASNDISEGSEGETKIDYENIQRSKLRVDARKWVVSKMLPKKYGDKPADDKQPVLNFENLSLDEQEQLQSLLKKAQTNAASSD